MDTRIKIQLLNITYKTIKSNSPSYLLDLLNSHYVLITSNY